ncbi:hypothetical protein [Pelagibius sp.]|uniref:hypothetical protein n=1 Tax=Pelagibius sp. TaxID=1931238 RepID=UPI003B50A65E
MIRLLSAVGLVLTLLAAGGEAVANDEVEVIYVGIGYETLIPITRDTIEQSAQVATEVAVSDPRLRAFKALIETAEPGSFDDNRIRARIRFFEGSTLFMDNDGGIAWHRHRVVLRPAALQQVDKLLTAMVGLALMEPAYDWVTEAARTHVRQNERWHNGAYNVTVHSGPDPDGSIVVAKVLHRLDTTNGAPDYRLVEPRSYELHFDAGTRALLRKVRYQQ